MGWIFGRKPRPAGKADRAAGVRSEPEVHRSPALSSLLADLRGPRVEILDLGAAIGANVEFLSPLGCKLYIEDLYAALAARGGGAGADAAPRGAEFFAEFLPLPEDVRFDAVFAWDLFNYLRRDELAAFAARLDRHCQPGTKIFALISYLKTMPAQPNRYRFRDEGTLAYERRTTVERPSPRLATSEIPELLPGFRVDRSFLLRNGYQEYVLVREG
jgi:hypothetical protein